MAQILLLVALLGALGAFDYEQVTQLYELSRVCLLALFLWLASSTIFDSRWTLYVFLPPLGAAFFVLFYAYVFTLRTGNPLLPSILAQRSYVFFLLGPVVYMLYVRGWKLVDFQRVFISAVFITTMSLVAYDLALAPQSLLLSGSFFESNLAEASNQSSTFRTINSSALFLVLYFGRRLLQTKDALFMGFSFITVALSAALVAISMPRSLSASITITLILYAVALSRPERVKLSVIMLPLYISVIAISLPSVRNAFVDTFGQDRTYRVREETAQTAWESFLEYPLFGLGQASYESASFQALFGQSFHPSDIGLLGVAFQFGLIGSVLYLFLTGWLCVSLLKLYWACVGNLDPKQSTFLWALFIVCLSFLVASPIQAKFIYGVGLPIGAFAWGLLMAHRRDLSSRVRKDPHGNARPVAANKLKVGSG